MPAVQSRILPILSIFRGRPRRLADLKLDRRESHALLPVISIAHTEELGAEARDEAARSLLTGLEGCAHFRQAFRPWS
jgi:hypothetical protein